MGAHPERPHSDGSAPAAAGAKALPSRDRRRCVLYAEDDESVARFLGRLLQYAGYDGEWASNGREAPQRIQANPAKYHLLITDHDMPVLDGLGLVHGLRQTGFAGGLLVHSSALTRSDEEAYQALGVTNFVAKPVESSRLLAEIARLASPPANPPP